METENITLSKDTETASLLSAKKLLESKIVAVGEYSSGQGIQMARGACVLKVATRASEIGRAFNPEDVAAIVTPESVNEVMEGITPRIFDVLRGIAGEILKRREEKGEEKTEVHEDNSNEGLSAYEREVRQITQSEEETRRNILSIRDKTIDLVQQALESAKNETIDATNGRETDQLVKVTKSELIAMIAEIIKDISVKALNEEVDTLLEKLGRDANEARERTKNGYGIK